MGFSHHGFTTAKDRADVRAEISQSTRLKFKIKISQKWVLYKLIL
jgi:hypothetical protein